MLEAENDLHCYDLYPKVVPVGRPVTFTLRTMDPDLLRGAVTHVDVLAINSPAESLRVPLFANVETTPLEAPQQGFRFTVTPPSEQEYQVQLVYEETGVKRSTAFLHFYAVEDDLLMRKPLVGDFHAHTFFSDGREGPAFVAAHYRQNGYDFTAITDHRRMPPSYRAIAALEGLDIPFRVYHGEEVHPNKSFVHIVNFASDVSVNEYALADKTEENWRNTDPTPEWEAELEKVAASLDDLPEGVDRKETARCVLTARKIKEGGGMAILAHPHWRWRVYNVPDPMNEYFWQHGVFDAMELIGGQTWHENMGQINLYNEWRARGRQIPVVGSSDEHGVLWSARSKPAYFTEERTVVYAKENSRDAIIEAVKGPYSTVVLKYVDQYPQIYGGGYRLELFTMFLVKNYFPLRDELYFEEGRLLHEYIAGTPGAKERLLATVAANAGFEEKYYCRT